jgi:translation initiation factor 3 subunit F
MKRLLEMLETTSDHVDQVVAGKITPDNEVGREIAATLAAVPRVRPEVFDRVFNDSLQDLLMTTYLSNLTRTQLAIASKLKEVLN